MKREFGFQGYIMSDWSAQHSTMSAVAGLDVSLYFLRIPSRIYGELVDDDARRYHIQLGDVLVGTEPD